MLLTGSVANPAVAQNPDGSQPLVSQGRHGEVLIAASMGKYGAMAQRGNVFFASTVIAGVALPVNAATLAATFSLWNPAGSGKNVELIEFTMGIDSATEVVNGLALAWQANASLKGVATSTTAAANIGSTMLGLGVNPVSKAWTAATMTNTAVLPIYPLGLNFDATAVGRSGNFTYQFDGKFWLPPDTIATFVNTVAPNTAAPCGMVWAEWLP